MTAEQVIERANEARAAGRLNDAAQLYREAAGYLRDEPLRYAHTIRHCGDILLEAGQTEGAESCILEAVTIYRRHADVNSLDLANALRSNALLAERRHQFRPAASLWAEARDLYTSLGVDAGVEEATSRLAHL